MNDSQVEINPQQIIETINENIQAIKDGFDPKKISKKGREEIIKDIDEIEQIILAIKKKLED